jgi:hypothetical protein
MIEKRPYWLDPSYNAESSSSKEIEQGKIASTSLRASYDLAI